MNDESGSGPGEALQGQWLTEPRAALSPPSHGAQSIDRRLTVPGPPGLAFATAMLPLLLKFPTATAALRGPQGLFVGPQLA